MKIASLAKFFSVFALFYWVPNTAYAYLDPGTGSLLFSAVLGIISTIYFWGKALAHKFIHFISIVTGKKVNYKDRGADIVLYSEGAQYWNTFKPVIDSLSELETPVTYWTSDELDPGLSYQSKGMTAEFIGKGNRAFARLNMMQAKVCVSTTPGLDVLQIKRSKGVQHYAHLVHAPTTGTYKLYSFDYFDSVMCSGQHQIDAIRELEEKRGTPEKILWETGCTYMDVLAQKVLENKFSNLGTSQKTTVLVAPSWGENGLLYRFGENILTELLGSQYEVILRPHPNSLLVEKQLLKNIEKSLEDYDNISWDKNPSGLESFKKADILISDFSGVVFDFAFVFEKPVITIDFDVELSGLDANDLSNGLWELNVLDTLGKKICQNDLSKLPSIVSELVQSETSKNADFRSNSIFNYGNAGSVAANQIQKLVVAS